MLGVVGALVYRETHKRPAITVCPVSHADGLSLTNEKDKKIKAKDARRKPFFEVEKLNKDLGACQP